jgi:regulator of sigma E protease
MLGGIIVNVITGIIIFVVLVHQRGETYYSRDQVIQNGIVALEIGQQIGFKDGDKILDINGLPYESINELSGGEALLSSGGFYTVDRGGEILKIEIPRGFINSFNSEQAMSSFINIRVPFDVKEVSPNSSAEKIGLKAGDKIVGVNGSQIAYFNELQSSLEDLKGKEATLVVERNGETLEKTAQISDEGTIGIAVNPLLEPVVKKYGIAESISKGTQRAFGVVIVNAKALGKMFTGEVSAKNVSGPIGMAKIYGNSWDWVKFWSITGLISMILAFMNLLPIPALDGGHVMFLLYEMVSGQAPSDKFLENAQKVGMVLLLALMVFAIGNDILKLFTGP